MKKVLAIAGPTAVGKTRYAIKLAQRFNGEIVSCDSMQIYKYMNIGSAKPSEEELSLVPHYLIGEIDPRNRFSAAMYQKKAKKAIDMIFEKGKFPIISGGTGLYLNSLIYEMDFSAPPADTVYRDRLESLDNNQLYELLKSSDAEAADRIHPHNKQKMIRALEAIKTSGAGIRSFDNVCQKSYDYEVLLIGLSRNRKELYNRIDKRVDLLVQKGLIDEVKGLLDMGLTEDDISMKGIGYKEIIDWLHEKYDFDRAVELVKRNSRRYAKRQMTWFRRYDEMTWFDLSQYSCEEKALEDIILWVQKNR